MKSTIDQAGLLKLIVVVLVVVAASFLGYVKVLDSQAVATLLGASLGYVFGNEHGIISARKQVEE